MGTMIQMLHLLKAKKKQGRLLRQKKQKLIAIKIVMLNQSINQLMDE